MTPEKQRIAIEKIDGWEYSPTLDHARHGPWVNHSEKRRVFERDLPDYLNSVDAMLSAVQKLTPRQREVFAYLLALDSDFPIPDENGLNAYYERPYSDLFESITQPPEVWAKCFLRAVGKWEGE